MDISWTDEARSSNRSRTTTTARVPGSRLRSIFEKSITRSGQTRQSFGVNIHAYCRPVIRFRVFCVPLPVSWNASLHVHHTWCVAQRDRQRHVRCNIPSLPPNILRPPSGSNAAYPPYLTRSPAQPCTVPRGAIRMRSCLPSHQSHSSPV